MELIPRMPASAGLSNGGHAWITDASAIAPIFRNKNGPLSFRAGHAAILSTAAATFAVLVLYVVFQREHHAEFLWNQLESFGSFVSGFLRFAFEGESQASLALEFLILAALWLFLVGNCMDIRHSAAFLYEFHHDNVLRGVSCDFGFS